MRNEISKKVTNAQLAKKFRDLCPIVIHNAMLLFLYLPQLCPMKRMLLRLGRRPTANVDRQYNYTEVNWYFHITKLIFP